MYSLEQVAKKISQLKNKKIVLVGGSFDLLHVGHIKFLAQAKKLGDVLIAAVNSDRIIKARKGKHRPVISEEHRAAILSELKCVDFVFVAREPFIKRALGMIKPDILVFTIEHGRMKSFRQQANFVEKHYPFVRPVFLSKKSKILSTTKIERKILHRKQSAGD